LKRAIKRSIELVSSLSADEREVTLTMGPAYRCVRAVL
jgi:hypothetical protein